MIHRLLISSSTPSNLSPVSEFDNGRISYRLPQTKLIAVYVSGGLFAIGWWAFIDALVYNREYVVVTIEEVITGIITTLGMIIVALIDKSIFSGEFYIFPRRMLWKARLYLFFGFTLLVGGLIGSVVYFVYKYLLSHDYTDIHEYYFGVAVVVQNGCILMSSLILLIGQYSNNEAKYDFL